MYACMYIYICRVVIVLENYVLVVVNKDRNFIRCQYFWRCVAGLRIYIYIYTYIHMIQNEVRILLFYEIIVILACEYVSVRNHIKYFFLNHEVGRNYYS